MCLAYCEIEEKSNLFNVLFKIIASEEKNIEKNNKNLNVKREKKWYNK